MAGIIEKEIHSKIYYEIAYSIMPDQWNKGYATECATCLRAFAKEDSKIKEVISIIHQDNTASIKVAKKNKMTVLRKDNIYDMPVYIYHKFFDQEEKEIEKCPFCENILVDGFIYGDRYALKWLPKNKKLFLGLFAVGGIKISDYEQGRPGVRALNCSNCKKMVIDYHGN